MTPLFQVVVCAAILNDAGRVFIARRAPQKKLGGFWEFPGGKLEPGEELEDALKRELFEELNIEVRITKLLHVKPHVYPHGAVLILFYLCESPSGELQLRDHDRALWVSLEELKGLKLLPANEEALAKLHDELQVRGYGGSSKRDDSRSASLRRKR